jgi:hypothetical protein
LGTSKYEEMHGFDLKRTARLLKVLPRMEKARLILSKIYEKLAAKEATERATYLIDSLA